MKFESQEETKHGYVGEKTFKVIVAKKFPKLGERYKFEFQKAQWTPNRINRNKIMSKLKNKKKEQVPEAAKEKLYTDTIWATREDRTTHIVYVYVTKKHLDESESGEWKSWLKAQHSEN